MIVKTIKGSTIMKYVKLGLLIAVFLLLPVVTVGAVEVADVRIMKYGPPSTDPPVQPDQVIPWGIERVNAIEAALAVDESGVIVAVIDTGMDLDHPDLAARYIWGYDFVNDDASPDDDHGHGTHCAGTIAGIDNDIGVIGVAPDVGLYIFKALDRRGRGSNTDIAASIYAATEGPDGVAGTGDDADVISMSLGGGYSSEIEAAVNFALAYDVVVVAATGNDGAVTPSYPAALPGVIKVGATDIDDNIASFSNRGETILAPGVSVFSTYKGASYATMSGTSMATPHVAGVCALAWAAHPTYTGVQIRLLVEGSADALGIVNALAVI
jgi:subtilisin family serine protease